MTALARAATRFFFVVFVLASLILVSLAFPGKAEVESLGSCIADGNGRFPSSTLQCILRIPRDTVPGEYNVVGRCPTGSTTGGYPPTATAAANSTGPLGVSTNRLNPGQSFTASGELCAPNAVVTFTLERIGALAAVGEFFSGAAYAQTGTRTMTARITVVGEPRATAASATNPASTDAAKRGALARTGFPIIPILAVGTGALMLGSMLVLLGRRRSRRASELTG